MELTRRDLAVALSAAGVGSVAVGSMRSDGPLGDLLTGDPVSSHEVETLVALAEAIYPSGVENVEGFVRDYSVERVRDDEAYARGVAEAVGALDDYVSEWHDDPYAALPAGDRADLLEHMAVDAADPDPEGTASERIRYYLVNELLYAFYATPTGAGLAGLENPPGYPGGTRSYRRGAPE